MSSSGLSKKMYLALSSLTLLILGLAGCVGIEVGVEDVSSTEAEPGEGNLIEIGVEPTPTPAQKSYTNDFYGFKFDYPEIWTLTEDDHRVVLKKGTNRLGIFYRWVNEDVRSERTGVGAGDFIYSGKIYFMGQIIPAEVLLFELKSKAVFYGGTSLIERDDLAFTIALEDWETRYEDVDLSEEIMTEAKSIVESFEQIEAIGTPPEEIPTTWQDGPPPPETYVVAWLGHIASLPEGNRFDDKVILAQEGTGEFGLKGATPEIEAEINSLRDSEGPNEHVHLWGTLNCGVEDYNKCQLSVDRLQYGEDIFEQDISDWFGTIKKFVFNNGESYVFEQLGYFPLWYGINASQNESLKVGIEHYAEIGEIVEVSGKLLVGVPDVNGTRIEISSIEMRSMAGPRPDIKDGILYENEEYGFSFQYPSHMSVVEEPNRLLVNNGKLQLSIAYRRADENISLAELGELPGQFHLYTELLFLGQPVQPSLNIQDGFIKAVYLGGPGIELGEGTPLRFVVSLVNTDGTTIANAQVDEMLQIFQFFELASQSD
jgi:hypothetical protein